jgi:hypothetical protein
MGRALVGGAHQTMCRPAICRLVNEIQVRVIRVTVVVAGGDRVRRMVAHYALGAQPLHQIRGVPEKARADLKL